MKKIPFLICLCLSIQIIAQSAEVTTLDKYPSQIMINPVFSSNRYVQNKLHFFAYNFEFDENGKLIGNTDYCVDPKDLPLEKGYLESTQDWDYIPYDNPSSPKKSGLAALTGTTDFSLYSKDFVSDYFIASGSGSYYRISEDLTVTHSFKNSETFDLEPQQKQVLNDGCIYTIYTSSTGFKIHKIDVVNQKSLTVDIPMPAGTSLVSTFPYRYNTTTNSPESFYLSINADGSKVFFGFCPGKKTLGYGDRGYYIESKGACFYIIDGASFEIDKKYEFDYPEEHLVMYKYIKNGIEDTFIEDVFFTETDAYVLVTSLTTHGVNPIAIYKLSLSGNGSALLGTINNVFDEGLALERDHGKIFKIRDRILLIYPIKMTDDKNYKAFNKKYQTIQVVDITTSNFSQTMIKDELADYKMTINMTSGVVLNDGNLLFISSLLGLGNVYERFYAVKVIVN